MSDNWLKFIPLDPKYQPSCEAAREAEVLLRSFVPRATNIVSEFKDNVHFFDAGGNWSGVNCPSCGRDAEVWWGDAMDAAFRTNFTNLEVRTPCCGSVVSLNEMKYIWPVGFGRFAIEAKNPDVIDLAPEQESKLALCLGCELRKIWVHI